MKDVSWFLAICADNGLKLSDEQATSFETYLKLLLLWNSRINMISRKDEDNFYSRHVLNCISFLFNRGLKRDAKILDLGTGGGLPGIPLKILCPDLNIILLDSIAKKTAALSDIVNKMQLENVEVVNGRAEELSKLDEFQGKFDYVVTRAAAKLNEVTRWSRGFLKPSELIGNKMIPVGMLIVLKGGTIDDELRAARNINFVNSIEVDDITFKGMNELDNKEKKLILIKYSALEKKN
ncbi:MAG TPA: 16S rRNA (guanine(527)-N(7))-methyltransferase RsmG [Candidatus Acidoferrales bacterium]|nr:16S rRNA (guanine(527)-N(7))-methyltransferase RsmG [Candidatus Acidoferrales bacterium]